MPSTRLIESVVGLFMLGTAIALSVLAIKISGLTSFLPTSSYHIQADFSDIGQLKVRAPVKIGGVQIGKVTAIILDPTTFKANVIMRIQSHYQIPDDSSVAILTAGLLGDNYIAVTPMYSNTFLHEGGEIQFTHSAMVLEKLIGELLFKLSKDQSNKDQGGQNAKL